MNTHALCYLNVNCPRAKAKNCDGTPVETKSEGDSDRTCKQRIGNPHKVKSWRTLETATMWMNLESDSLHLHSSSVILTSESPFWVSVFLSVKWTYCPLHAVLLCLICSQNESVFIITIQHMQITLKQPHPANLADRLTSALTRVLPSTWH